MNIFLLAIICSTLAVAKIYLFFAFIYCKKYDVVPSYLLNLSYNSIYYYSKLQLSLIKTQNTVTSYVKSVPFLNNLLTYMNPDTNSDIYTYTTVNNNLSICNKYNREKNINQKIILKYIPNDKERKCIESLKHEQCDYKFIMTEITIDDKKFVVHFTTDKYNYLTEYNKLDSNFINYFLKTHYNELVKDLEIENYSIKIIDHNVNIIEFDNTKTLLINKNDYILVEQLNIY
jgi:hypothetical protein